MINNTKTFRLFISSTFSDFQVEREVLQTKIFPEIKKYCSSKGYTFQPIDLRWGVSNEAQLDQKALDMCIKEVQSCKTYDYPNFLIMLGDRYGWVPLPNIIEKGEFKLITKNMMVEDKELLSNWYYEDKNQIPISYILKQRIDKYKDYNTWEIIESKLRDILQNAVKNLDDIIQNKYYTSATESEAIEGIISYFTKTEYQKKLLDLVPELSQLDHKHIFGFFRTLEKDTDIKDKFISDDYEKAQEFKEKVKSQLKDENVLDIKTSQISKDRLDESYLETFTSSVVEFLKIQVDLQIEKDKEKNYSTLEIEKQQQNNYLNQKLENFTGQEKVLNDIQNYIEDDSNKPLIISGQSGIGKSSIMAKAIEEISNTIDKKIIYRFVGASPNSTTTTDILTSILKELNVSIEDEQVENKNQFLTDIDKEENSFVNFSYKVYDEIIDIKEDIVIFIDAVDQLSNDDQFLWLPNKLPSNIKIVISTLKDNSYKEDSKYFYALEDKISSYIDIESFDKPLELLTSLLKQKDRTLQDEQKEYFLTQYNKVNTPLYVNMAANEMHYWKSSDKVGDDVTLSFSQKDIVKKLIEDLTTIHHHDKLLIQKVFGYIIESKDGLSEFEILELLNTDKEFIKYLAPDTWHINTTQELPLVIWTRLYNHIKPFLSKKNQDGQELLYFFHREFIDAVQNQSNQKAEHESIIKATQKLIEINQDKEFDSNRWGKLYTILLGEYLFKYGCENRIQVFCKNIIYINNKWLITFVQFLQETGWRLNTLGKFDKSLLYRKLTSLILEKLDNKSSKWLYLSTQSSHNVASTLYRLNQTIEAIKIEEKNLNTIEKISNIKRVNSIKFIKYVNTDFLNEMKNENDLNKLASLMWTDSYLKVLSVLSACYSKENRIADAIKLDEKSLYITKSLLFKDPFWIKHYITSVTNLSEALSHTKKTSKIIKLLEDALLLIEKIYDKKSGYMVEDYARVLNNLSLLLINSAPRRSEKLRKESEELINSLYIKNPDRYSDQIHNITTNNTSLDIANGNMKDIENKYYKIIKIFDNLENTQKEKWIKDTSNDLLISSHDYYQQGNYNLSINYLQLNKKIAEYVYNQDQHFWGRFYTKALISLAKVLNDTNQSQEAILLQSEAINICERNISSQDNEWYDLYTKNMNNLANTYTSLNNKNAAYLLNKKNLDISTKLFKKDQQKWFRAYYYALKNMEATYRISGEYDKEDSLKLKIKEVESNPLSQSFQDIVDSKLEKKINYIDHIAKFLLILGILFIFYYFVFE